MGDEVKISLNQDGTGNIEEIKPRRNYLSRKAPRIKGAAQRGERLEQIIAANVDSLIIVGSVMQPNFNNKLIDRIIVAGESSHLNVKIIINKIDLGKSEINFWNELYSSIGYEVMLTSALSKHGLNEMRDKLAGRKNLFWGASGVGKSSLLNSVFPGLDLKTKEISAATSKGKHTTVTTQMIKVNDSTFVIDTPGIREIDPYGIKKEDLGHYFVEFDKYINNCRFNTCTHHHEPGCGIIDAVEGGVISPERYESYLNILDTIEDGMIF